MAGRPPKRREGNAPDPEQRVEAVERALALLDCFDEAAPVLNLTELARKAGLYPSTVLRLCSSLERCGYLRRNDSGHYRPGSKLHRLGRLYEQTFPLAELIRPVLRQLSEITGETAAFYVREAEQRLCLFRVNGPRPVRSHLDEGSRLPLDKGAAGHVLMAWGGGQSSRYDAIRKQGYCVSRGERDVDSAAIAVPIFRDGSEFIGALGLAGPITRFGDADIDRLRAALQDGAARISAE